MKAENKDTFATSKAIKQIISDLRITKQKTTKITPFEAHFGRPANTPLRNISTSPSNLNLTYEKIINHYFDADTVPVDDYLDDAGWTNPERSDLDIEKSMNKAQQDAGLRYRDADNKESRFLIHPKITNPIHRTEKPLNVKLARKLPNKKRAKRQLAGLYEVLKPGSFVTKSSPTTTIINEPGRSPVKKRDSDLAKFGTKAERSTNLWAYAQRRPAPYEQTTETKIAKDSNDVKRQKRGEIRIGHRHRDTTSVVSSVNSNVSRALTVSKPAKPQPKRSRYTVASNENDNATASEQPLISIVPTPPMSSSQDPVTSSASQEQQAARKRKRPQFYGFADADISPTSSLASSSSNKSKKRKSKKEKKGSTNENTVVTLIQNAEQSRIPSPPRPDIQIGQASPPDSTVRYYEYEQERELSVWDAENEI